MNPISSLAARLSRLVIRLYRAACPGKRPQPTDEERHYADILIATYGKLD